MWLNAWFVSVFKFNINLKSKMTKKERKISLKTVNKHTHTHTYNLGRRSHVETLFLPCFVNVIMLD